MSAEYVDIKLDSDFRPLAIFTTYMAVCVLLTLLLIHSIYRAQVQNYNPPLKNRRYVILFTILAVLSLATTWTHMFRFFAHSYQTWVMAKQFSRQFFQGTDTNIRGLQLALWLRDTQLFKEAWGAVVVTPERLWWSQQIFYFAAIWAVFMNEQSQRRIIPYIWAYMLLGQIVAISFASNLFFLSVLRRRPQAYENGRGPKEGNGQRGIMLTLHVIASIGTALAVRFIPQSTQSPQFLLVLAIPHVLLLLPPFAQAFLPKVYLAEDYDAKPIQQRYNYLKGALLLDALFQQLTTTLLLARRLGDAEGAPLLISRVPSLLWETLWETPAVSSVGWDVILCWVSWGFWLTTQRSKVDDAVNDMEPKEKKEM